MTANEHQMFGSVRRLCSKTPTMIRTAHWTNVVRREIAAELDRLALIHNDIANSSGTYPMEATVHMGFCLEMQKRAKEIRRG